MAEIKAALKERTQILIERGLVNVFEQKITINKNLLDSLRKRELDNYKHILRRNGYNVYYDVPRGFVGNVKEMIKLFGVNYGLMEGR